MSRPTQRRVLADRPHLAGGFTLVELLVVIAIIGTLVALLLPAVQSARETARANTCRNNLKQLVTGMTNYDASQGKLPGYINEIGNKATPETEDGFSGGRRASWLVMAFPYLEEGPLWDRWTQEFPPLGSTPPDAFADANNSIYPGLPEIIAFQCPSDAPDASGTPANSYVANAGQGFGDQARGASLANGLPQSRENFEYLANGVFFDLNRKSSAQPAGGGWTNTPDDRGDNPNVPPTPRLQMTIDYVQGGDGTSKTIMLSENLYAFHYSYDFGTNDPERTVDTRTIQDAKHHFGFIWEASRNPGETEWRRINGARALEDPPLIVQWADLQTDARNGSPAALARESLGYPSSNHPGGVNMAFCDGRVQFVTDNIAYQVYAQGMTTKYKRSKYYNEVSNQADRNLPQPTDADFK